MSQSVTVALDECGHQFPLIKVRILEEFHQLLFSCYHQLRRQIYLLDSTSDCSRQVLVTGSGTTVQYQWCITAGFHDLGQTLKIDMWRSLISAVRRSDGNCQAIYASLLDEFRCLIRLGQIADAIYLIVDTHAHVTQLSLYADTQSLRNLYDLLCLL